MEENVVLNHNIFWYLCYYKQLNYDFSEQNFTYWVAGI